MAISITVPRLGWTMEEGVFLGWLKQDGDPIRAGEPIFTLESEKAAQEVEATDGGILRISPTAPAAGSVVLVGALIGYLVSDGEQVEFETPGASSAPQSEPAKSIVAIQGSGSAQTSRTSHSAPESVRPEPGSATLTISPRAARTAAALNVDWKKIRGTGRTGRIRERDVLAAASEPARHTARDQSAIAEPQMPGRMEPVSSTRRTIARRMSAGVHEAAPVTLTTRADATNLLRRREQIKAVGPSGPVPTLNDFFVKLVSTALQRHPSLNAQWHGDRIFHPDEINIAIAIDTDNGLVAPVIHNVSAMGVTQLAAASIMLIEHARGGRLSPDELKNGTFTVTNLGRLGVEFFTPIINLPQCAILGIGRIVREPVVKGDQIAAHDMVPVSLTFDHRVVDGAPAARFLETLVQLIESVD